MAAEAFLLADPVEAARLEVKAHEEEAKREIAHNERHDDPEISCHIVAAFLSLQEEIHKREETKHGEENSNTASDVEGILDLYQ